MNSRLETLSASLLSGLPSGLLDRLTLILVFLFPLCGNLFKSWYSSFFALIAISSLFYLKKGWPLLDRYQKSMAYALVLYFAVFLINATLLGWQSPEIKALGVEIRLLFILPFLCMATVIPATRTALYLGLAGSLVIFLGQTFYELLMMQQWRVNGAYNPLRISAMALVAMSLLTPWLYFKQRYVAAIAVVLCCTVIIVGAQGRMAMIAALIIATLFCLIVIKKIRYKLIVLTGIVIIVSTAASTPMVQLRFAEIDTLTQYITKEETYSADETPGSWVTHYMMLEASWLVLKEHPMLGVGSRHYHDKMLEYLDAQLVHPIIGHPHLVTPHTLPAEIAVSKGMLGLVTFSLFIIMAIRLAYHRGQQGIAQGLFVLCILLTGISEAWWIRTGSFVAIMVLFMAILSAPDKVKSSH